MKLRYLMMLALGLSVSACDNGDGGEKGDGAFPEYSCAKDTREHCVEVTDAASLLATVNMLDDQSNTTIVLGAGTYKFDNEVSISGARSPGVHLIGQGMEKTILDFQMQGLGLTVTGGENFLVQDLTVLDATKDGIRVEDVTGVVFRRIRATWTNEGDSENGVYGIYPVKSRNVLVEDSYAENASDAGLYVGQCMYAIVRNNVVRGNVAGLEIENTQYADVYGNLAEDNTGGIVVFDLPGNPIVGRDVRLRDNVIRDNNRKNFAAQGVVKEIPAGTGTFAMASRRVEITNNEYSNNNTLDIAVIDGRVVDPAEVTWNLSTDTLIGDWEDLGLPVGVQEVEGEWVPLDTTIGNYKSTEVVITGNTHSGSGTKADQAVEFGQALGGLFRTNVPEVLYDVLGETSFDEDTLANNSNDNHICVGGNPEGRFATVNLRGDILGKLLFPDSRAPFDCEALTDGPVAPVEIAGVK